MTENTFTYELILPLNGTKKFAEATEKFLSVFTMWKPSKCQLIDYDCWKNMADNGLLRHESYWKVNKGCYGIICLIHYKQYSDTLDKMRQAYNDFKTGWNACNGK